MNPTREPVVWTTLVQAVIRYGILAAISLGLWEMTENQVEAVLQFAIAFLALVDFAGAWFLRRRVSPVGDQ